MYLFIFINNKNKPYFIVAIIILTLLYIYGFFRINNYQVIYSKNELRIVHTYLDQKDKWTNNQLKKLQQWDHLINYSIS